MPGVGTTETYKYKGPEYYILVTFAKKETKSA